MPAQGTVEDLLLLSKMATMSCLASSGASHLGHVVNVNGVDDFFASYGRSERIDNAVSNVCGLKAAGIYTRVQAYLTWIHSVMQGVDHNADFEIWGGDIGTPCIYQT